MHAHPDDVADRLLIGVAEAFVLALRGETAEARAVVERVEREAATVDMAPLVDVVRRHDAAVRALLGDRSGARRLLEELVESTEARGYHGFAAGYRRELAALA